jgi:hypothetical protein
VLDIPVPKVSLQGSSIMPFVGQCVAAGMAEHVRMGLKAQLGLAASPLDHAGEPCGAKGRTTLRREDEGRLWLLLALKAPQGSQLISEDRMCARRTPLDPANMQRPRSEVDLIPTEVNKFGGPKAVGR